MTRASAGPGLILSPEQRLAWLRLIRSENVGPATFLALINRFGSAQAALDALPELAARGGSRRRIRVATAEDAEAELARAASLGARFICRGEPDFPRLLAMTEAMPPVLAVMGEATLLNHPSVAIVGSRNASLAGVKFAAALAQALGGAGHAIVSGLARGIDAAAHEASLGGGTVGVFAGGLDKPYPDENRPLMRRIVDAGGCLVTEMPFGWVPRAADFPRRNRIVAGLALGLVVVEAAARSGSLISARLAGELGRLVFAVPGSPVDPRAAGTNRLLKEGAILVTEAADILDALRPLDSRMTAAEFQEPADETAREQPAEDERVRILQALGPAPVRVDDIIVFTGAPAGAVQLVLLELDLAGRLERHGDGSVSLVM